MNPGMRQNSSIREWYQSGSPSILVQGQCLREAVFPGAFNPVHAGHLRMAEIAEEKLGVAPSFEISVENVDKPPLSPEQLEQRLALFPEGSGVWLTRAPTFVEKARLFPEVTFVVGADTLVRIGSPRYYQGRVSLRDTALRGLTESGCRFLVFGRWNSGQFQTLEHLRLPASLRRICRGISESEFREDISSTQLRQ